MGQAKRELERLEQQEGIALEIAIKAGVLNRCEFHEDVIFEDSGDTEAAYKLANKMFSSGEVSEHFSTRRELTDTIKKVIENAAEECYSCAKWAED